MIKQVFEIPITKEELGRMLRAFMEAANVQKHVGRFELVTNNAVLRFIITDA